MIKQYKFIDDLMTSYPEVSAYLCYSTRKDIDGWDELFIPLLLQYPNPAIESKYKDVTFRTIQSVLDGCYLFSESGVGKLTYAFGDTVTERHIIQSNIKNLEWFFSTFDPDEFGTFQEWSIGYNIINVLKAMRECGDGMNDTDSMDLGVLDSSANDDAISPNIIDYLNRLPPKKVEDTMFWTFIGKGILTDDDKRWGGDGLRGLPTEPDSEGRPIEQDDSSRTEQYVINGLELESVTWLLQGFSENLSEFDVGIQSTERFLKSTRLWKKHPVIWSSSGSVLTISKDGGAKTHIYLTKEMFEFTELDTVNYSSRHGKLYLACMFFAQLNLKKLVNMTTGKILSLTKN